MAVMIGNPSLEQVKRRLRSHYLGKHGIHGFGIRRADNAVCVYARPGSDADSQEMLSQLRSEAHPFQILVIKEEPPFLT